MLVRAKDLIQGDRRLFQGRRLVPGIGLRDSVGLPWPQFRAFFKAVDVKGLKSLLLTQAGAYFSRTSTGRPTVLSNHALGTAIDINAAWNGFGVAPARRGAVGSLAPLADFCADFGLYWGGWYSGRKDGMHFECVTLQDEAALRSACTTHGVDYDALFAAGTARR